MIARISRFLAGVFGLVSTVVTDGEGEQRVARSTRAQHVFDQVNRIRKRRSRGARASYKKQGTPANPYGNNRARRGGFKRRYSGHV